MKLFSKYNQVNVIATILVLLIGSTCYYFIIRFVLIKQLDNALKVEETEILAYVKNKNILPEPTNYRDQMITFAGTEKAVRRKFINITLFDSAHGENNPYRQLIFPVSADGKMFTASVTKSEVETEDLLLLIVLITVGVIVLLLLILFVANRVLLRKIWRPFYDTLQAISAFNISRREVIPENQSEIDEFKYLGAALSGMTGKFVKDYEVLKNFAENASHEMQTPLAIINSKLDLMIQDQRLDEKQMKPLQELYDAVGRLRKLNQSLLLLTKIENKQFIHGDSIRLRDIITAKLQQLEDMFIARRLHVKTDMEDVSIGLNSYLADILLNNLLSNAFHHNLEGGSIEIGLRPGRLVISNTGPPLSFDHSGIFERFKKSNYSEGMGLGLAIVKQICDSCNYNIEYFFHDNLHSFAIRF